MYTVSVFDAPIGSIIAEPVILNNMMLINKGVSLSNSLKQSLFRLNIKTVSIEGTFSEQIDEQKLRFGSFDNLTYIAVRNLDFSRILICARTMVKALCEGNAIVEFLSVYDGSTMQHSINVAALALTTGIKMGLSIRELENLATGALLHDIGKIKVPSEILNKPDKLTDEEIAIIQKHPLWGAMILRESEINVPEPVRQIVYQHHEDFDGTGYPRKLSDYHIYRLARLVHICDVYDALCSKRAYKDALPKEFVWEIMDGYCGSKFDPFIYSRFKKLTPFYILGEEIVIGNNVGVITSVNNDEPDNPDVYFNGSILPLSKLSLMNEQMIKNLRGSEGILKLEKIL